VSRKQERAIFDSRAARARAKRVPVFDEEIDALLLLAAHGIDHDHPSLVAAVDRQCIDSLMREPPVELQPRAKRKTSEFGHNDHPDGRD
jgi:hypothetical protein